MPPAAAAVVVAVVGEDESGPFDRIPGAGDSLDVDVAPVRIHSGLKCKLRLVEAAEAVVGNVEDDDDIWWVSKGVCVQF